MGVRASLLGVFLLTGLAGACGGGSGASGSGEEPKDIHLGEDGQTVQARVPRNATLETLLRRNDLSAETTTAMVEAVRSVFNPREMRADQQYRITRTIDGLFREFRYQIDADRLLRVVLDDPAAEAPTFNAEVITLPKEYEIDALAVEIGGAHSSLVGALEAQGENIQLALELATIFGGEVDFNSDLRRGDRGEVLFERVTRYGEFAGYGEVKAAILDNDGRHLTAIRATDADGKPAWYDEEGRSLRRQFLQSPLPFDPRVTSRFSYSRRNPVLGVVRPHLGVDYAAPYGTAVRTVAAGAVEFAGFSGEAGRMIRIRHSGGYKTAYLHLSSIGPGIRVGTRVEQGQLIGRVGATGTATGPHLDYRIMKNGTYVNPLVELKRMPKGEPIEASRLPEFFRVRDEVLGELRARLTTAAPTERPGSHVPK